MDFEQFGQGFQDFLQSMGIYVTNQQILVSLVIGGIAGWIASQVVGGKRGLWRYVIAGILGSFLGPVIIGYIGVSIPVLGFTFVNEVIAATVGAIVIVLGARVLG